MKDIVLARGNGTRLYPVAKGVFEEIAFNNRWLSPEQLGTAGLVPSSSGYGKYPLSLLKENQ